MKIFNLSGKVWLGLLVAAMISAGDIVYAQKTGPSLENAGKPSAGLTQEQVQIDGDNVEYKADEAKFVASGNVVLHQSGSTLFCDRIEFFRDRQEAHAEGHVVLESDKGEVWADKAFYNFQTKRGEFTNARIMADPIFGRAETISKIRDNYYVMANGYLTTSDYDEPEWRIKSRQIEMFPGDKLIARNSTMYLGGIPVMYMPKYVQDLRKNRPHVRVIPGYSKDWGGFVLTSYRVYPVDGIETVYHLDYRERKDLSTGLDVALTPGKFGGGLLKTYYMNERALGIKHAWEERVEPTIERERYRLEWRHKYDFSPSTSAIVQFYRLSDSQLLKDYFEREYRQDSGSSTYSLLTHSTADASMSVRVDKRINHFEAMTERLPEISYSWNNQPVGDTGFYFKSTNTAVKMVNRTQGDADRELHTVRVSADNEVSRPFRIAFLEFHPFAGTEQSFYSRTLASKDSNSVRGVFRTGSDVSTKFYRVYGMQFKKMGIEINNLRHILTPTISYQYQHDPTMPSGKFIQFDSLDSRTNANSFGLGLESKFQTKREGRNADLLRSYLTSDFRMRDNPSGGSFGDVKLTNELYPNKYFRTLHDVTYNPDSQRLTTANVDMYFTDTKKWEFDVSRRYALNDDDLVTTQLTYKFNPKWRGVLYNRWNVDVGQWQEQQYALVRDLHSWEVECSFGTKNGIGDSGSQLWLIFRLKAFPSVSFDGGRSFFQTKPGSQSVQ